MIVAIHSIFIPKENILFLEQWLDYHIQIGFNAFYLYNNAKVQVSDSNHLVFKKWEPNSCNKYGINYSNIININDKEIDNILSNIINKYQCVKIIEWSPIDKNGYIRFMQLEAHNDFLKRAKEDGVLWATVIDMDEFIVLCEKYKNIIDYIVNLPDNISDIVLSQFRFACRYMNINKLIIDIDDFYISQLGFNHSVKHLFKIQNTEKLYIHGWNGYGETLRDNRKNVFFNHYKGLLTDFNNKKLYTKHTNINLDIKNIIYKNCKNYLDLNKYII